ncbi:MAG: FliA/WhiG family RNA polymerase sigma factor [Planctomycetes bacterium]|nr:FliA/WhiG family RNA polymerase sigma factor [Planctomycetota bacterium]
MSNAAEVYARTVITDEERNKLVEEFLPLVRHVLGRLPISLPAFMDREDLFEVGVLGLMNAARSYDSSRGAQFKTHAYVNIRGAILDELRRYDIVPRSRRDRMKLFHRSSEELEEQLGRPATPDEIAVAMGLSVEQVDDLLVNMHGASVLSIDDAESNEGDGPSLGTALACMNTPSPADAAEARELKARMAEEIQNLPQNERRVIVLYYAEGLLLKEIGEVLGVTESRVSQLHSRAIFKLNKALGLARDCGGCS